MITAITIHPNIFNISYLSDKEKSLYLCQLITWCKFCRADNSIIIFDKQNNLEQVIAKYIIEENNAEIRKQLTTIWQYISSNIVRSKLSSKQFSVSDACKTFFRLVDKAQPDIVFLQEQNCNNYSCKECMENYLSNEFIIRYSNKINEWQRSNCNYSNIPEQYNFNELIDSLNFKKLLKYCSNFILYDKNIIPESTNKITENYIYNLKKFLPLFKNTNIKLIIITYVKKTQIDEAESKIKETINIIKDLGISLNVPLEFKVMIGQDEQSVYKEQIHNRYIFTNLVNYSTDRGLNIINKYGNNLNYSYDINLISNEKAELFQNYLFGLKQYNVD